MEAGPGADRMVIVLDLHRVGSASRAATGILSATAGALVELGHEVMVIDDQDRHLVEGAQTVASLDEALTRARLPHHMNGLR